MYTKSFKEQQSTLSFSHYDEHFQSLLDLRGFMVLFSLQGEYWCREKEKEEATANNCIFNEIACFWKQQKTKIYTIQKQINWMKEKV